MEAQLRAAIAARGPLPFSEVVEAALYDPTHGFYETGGAAGRRGDFITSPEVGPLFGSVVARALDRWWEEAGRPDRWTVVDAGAGPGALARAVLAADPSCRPALCYVLVERSSAQRAGHQALLGAGAGQVESRPDLPPPDGPAVVLANELLDNLPFDVLERTVDGWAEVRVGIVEDALAEVLVPAGDAGPAPLGAPVGARVPLQRAAQAWLRGARRVAGAGGRVLVLDYAATTDELAARPQEEWLRTYRRHARGGLPLEALGGQDITCEVCVDQLAAVAPPHWSGTQRDWLVAHGIDELVAEGRRIWAERSALGDLAAVRARSRITEAEALCDPAGLGRFAVVEWSGDHPLTCDT